MHFSDMTQRDREIYFASNGPWIEKARAEFTIALTKYAAELKARGAFENSHLTAPEFVIDTLDRTDKALAEEVSRYLETTTGPRLALEIAQ